VVEAGVTCKMQGTVWCVIAVVSDGDALAAAGEGC
jgi:hypothetical protein